MAELTRSGASLASLTPGSDQLVACIAGEALVAGDACYIRASDGRAMRSTGAAAGAAAKVRGFAVTAKAVGEAITLAFDVRFNYGTALTPGADLYVSGTVPGGLADAASIGGTGAVGYVVDANRVHLYSSRY